MHRRSRLLFAVLLLWAVVDAISPTETRSEPISRGIPTVLPFIECGQVIEGVLEPGDDELDDGTWIDDYDFELFEEQPVVAVVTAEDFEPEIQISDFFFFPVDDGLSPLVTVLGPDAYVLSLNNLEPLPVGRYPYRVGLSCTVDEAPDVRCGETIVGHFDPNDDQLDDGTWFDDITFRLDEPTRVAFTLEGLGFDTYLFVDDFDGEPIADGVPPFEVDLDAGSYVLFPNNFDPLDDGLYPYFVSASCSESACPGDCDGDRVVTVDEIVRGVSIALGISDLADCPAFDGNEDGVLIVAEIVQAVNAALSGCP